MSETTSDFSSFELDDFSSFNEEPETAPDESSGLGGVAVDGGQLRPQHWALGAAAFLPTMVTVLALIIMESEALHHAKIGLLPDWVLDRFPKGAMTPIIEEEVTQ